MPEDPAVLPVTPVTKVAGVTTGGAYELPVYPFVAPAELRGKIGRHAVVVVGAGLAGLTAACDLRWKKKLVGCEQRRGATVLKVETPAGRSEMETHWVIDCSGSHSPLRTILNVPVQTEHVVDRWCISDVRFRTRPPAERWTWIHAPFNDDRAVWQHLMGDDVWRLDYQMAPDADPEQFSQPAIVADRLRRQFGASIEYELVWIGPYSYRSQCLEMFRVGRV